MFSGYFIKLVCYSHTRFTKYFSYMLFLRAHLLYVTSGNDFKCRITSFNISLLGQLLQTSLQQSWLFTEHTILVTNPIESIDNSCDRLFFSALFKLVLIAVSKSSTFSHFSHLQSFSGLPAYCHQCFSSDSIFCTK